MDYGSISNYRGDPFSISPVNDLGTGIIVREKPLKERFHIQNDIRPKPVVEYINNQQPSCKEMKNMLLIIIIIVVFIAFINLLCLQFMISAAKPNPTSPSN